MTVTTQDGSAVVPYDPSLYADNIGMEDVSPDDVIVPRLRIIGDEAVFEDNLSKKKYEFLDCVILGLVKQRIMWSDDVQDNERPLCKSPDHAHGFPNISSKVTEDKRFPWDESNFSPADAVPVDISPNPQFPDGWTSNGLPTLNCASCKFTNWGTDKSGKSVPPPCSEQYTFVIMYHTDTDEWITALITFQRSGVKATKSYISSFAQRRVPMFTTLTRLTLQPAKRGSVKYATPVFTQGVATDGGSWASYAEKYVALRQFVRAAPRPEEAEDDEGGTPAPSQNSNINGPPASMPPPAPDPSSDRTGAAVQPPPAPNPSADSTGAASAVAPPAPPAPPAPAPAAVAPPVAPPVAPAPPAPPAAAPTPAPAAPAPPAPAAQETPAGDDDDDLPF